MDIRVEKTRNSIINAFISIKSKKSLEKITVKEIVELAQINKTTFYRHYADVYELSDTIENELIKNVLESISVDDMLFKRKSVLTMAEAFVSQGGIFNIIFDDSRIDVAINKMHDCVMEKVLDEHPEYRENFEKKVRLTAAIYGTFVAFLRYRNEDVYMLLNILDKASKDIMY